MQQAPQPLTDAQQERYARHLLLDPLGGVGQERLLASAVFLDLPASAAPAARWCARYLAASGVGALHLAGPWAEAAAEECRDLGPDTRVSLGEPAGPALRLSLEGPLFVGAPGTAAQGAEAALRALRWLSGLGESPRAPEEQ
jgi:hypothetical protein